MAYRGRCARWPEVVYRLHPEAVADGEFVILQDSAGGARGRRVAETKVGGSRWWRARVRGGGSRLPSGTPAHCNTSWPGAA